jgi:hypothetical protein
MGNSYENISSRCKANKENAEKRAKGKTPKKDPKVVPNWCWYTVMYTFLDPHISGEKINPTPNLGPNAQADIALYRAFN